MPGRILKHLPSRRVLIVGCALLGLVAWFGRPTIAEIAQWQGRQALRNREFESALAWFERAAAINPGDGESHFWMARIERMRGRTSLMFSHLERAANVGFSADRIERERVLAMAQSGLTRPVEGILPRLLMDPGDDGPAICEAIVSGYLQAFRIKEAMSILEAWKRDYPDDPQPMVVRGMYFAHRQNWNGAASEFEAALKLAPRRDDIRAQWAESLRNGGDLKSAREQFERCRRTSPRDPEVLIGLGRCLLESGDLDEARSCFELALDVAPSSWSGRYWLGKLLVTAGESARAIPLLKELYRERPYEPDVRYTFAMALQATGQSSEAKEHFEYVSAQQRAQSELRNKLEILERAPSRTDLRFEIGKTLLDYGNPDEGLGWLQSVLQLDPNHAEARAAVEDFTSRQAEVPQPDKRED